MPSPSKVEIAALELNRRAPSFRIGKLQELRTRLKSLKRRPGNTIFSHQTIFDEWAFHVGGRSELQFNIGIEGVHGQATIRYGVAFSFEPSRSLPSIDLLVPKAARFNEFLRLYPDLYDDMRMWHYLRSHRSSDYPPTIILPELVQPGIFIFLGRREEADSLDYDSVLRTFDRLLPLYEYVEGGQGAQPTIEPTGTVFKFKAGCSPKASTTAATQVQRQLDVSLRHNELQTALYEHLVTKHGADSVGTELVSGNGARIDVVLRSADGYSFYEIKTAGSPRACIREAIGQLLEYAFWPGAQKASRLIVVGEPPLDNDGREYLRRLNERFPVPLVYKQVGDC
ncbi:hypothetical protein DC522_03185 [Microvirga sp. KLBC 81]|nr:hypothetical protein DC522_03185 [Microvirga sp. KLBC 81]